MSTFLEPDLKKSDTRHHGANSAKIIYPIDTPTLNIKTLKIFRNSWNDGIRSLRKKSIDQTIFNLV